MEKRFKLTNCKVDSNAKYLLITKPFGAMDTLIYLVNCSTKVLLKVKVSTGSFTIDGEVITPEDLPNEYRNVLPSEAVLIDTFNILYDSERLSQLSIVIYEEGRKPYELEFIYKNQPKDMILVSNEN